MKAIVLLVLLGWAFGVFTVLADNTNVEDSVAEAMRGVRERDFARLTVLVDAPERNEQMPYAKEYVSDPDPKVREAVVALARGVSTRESLEILTTLVIDNEPHVAWHSENALFEDFTCDELVNQGGEVLKKNLLLRRSVHRLQDRGVLMLGCFGSDPEVSGALSLDRAAANGLAYLNMYGTHVPARECYNLALAIAGNQDAVRAVVSTLSDKPYDTSWGSGNSFVFVLRSLKFVRDERILDVLIDRLDDKRDVLPAGPIHAPIQPIRLCDLIVVLLSERLHVDVGFPVKTGMAYPPIPRFTDAQLSRAYRLLKTCLQKRNFGP